MGQEPDRIRAEIEQTRADMSDTVDALGYKADVKSRATQKARRASSVAQENPLGLAIGSVAVGFIAGMLIPSTRVEDEQMGELSDNVIEKAKETGQEALETARRS